MNLWHVYIFLNIRLSDLRQIFFRLLVFISIRCKVVCLTVDNQIDGEDKKKESSTETIRQAIEEEDFYQ